MVYFCHSLHDITHSIVFFYLPLFFSYFCRQLTTIGFVIDILRLAFLWVFVLTVQMKKLDLTESSNLIIFVSMLKIYNLRYFMYF